MKSINDEPLDRRAFLRAAGRYTLLGIIVVTGSSLALRKQRTDSADEQCFKHKICDECEVLKSCHLPAAKVFREH